MPKYERIPDKYTEGYSDADLDDMGVVFRIWRAYLKDINTSRLLTFDDKLEDLLLANPRVKNYKRHTPYHATFTYGNIHVAYYPSKGKWSANGKRTINGGFESMINWLEKRV